MNCMKCGRETAGTDVFCEKCLAAIARYPVKPGTPVYLPKREEGPSVRSRKKRPPTQDEIIVLLRIKLRRRKLTILILVLLLLAALGALALALLYPPPILCTDNAAMICCGGYYEFKSGNFADGKLNAYPSLELGDKVIM